jgi:hypothetical protein
MIALVPSLWLVNHALGLLLLICSSVLGIAAVDEMAELARSSTCPPSTAACLGLKANPCSDSSLLAS